MELAEQLREGFGNLAIRVNQTTIERVLRYQELLLKWNRVTNLTSITEPGKVMTHHLLDAFSVHRFLTGKTILDVGAGAGIPGIPLAIINPDREFMLLDANGKKTRFMTQVKIELGLDNVDVVQCRVEEFDGSYDHVVSRAFRHLVYMADTCGHLVAAGGNLLAMKGPDFSGELTALDGHGYEICIHKLDVPGVDAERYLIELTDNRSMHDSVSGQST